MHVVRETSKRWRAPRPTPCLSLIQTGASTPYRAIRARPLGEDDSKKTRHRPTIHENPLFIRPRQPEELRAGLLQPQHRPSLREIIHAQEISGACFETRCHVPQRTIQPVVMTRNRKQTPRGTCPGRSNPARNTRIPE